MQVTATTYMTMMVYETRTPIAVCLSFFSLVFFARSLTVEEQYEL
jgi:hypothetical protein